tara:strand:- start:53 stop:667 length:615 start_codon:yes stop_codon:yes gene_type:complete
MDKPLSRAIKKVQKPKNVDEAIISGTLATLGKGAMIAGKALAKATAAGAKVGAKGAKVAAKTGSKAVKTGTNTVKKTGSTASRMAKGFDKNKNLIKNKRGLPSQKVANSGKNTVDPKKNTLPVEPLNDTPEKKTTTPSNASQDKKDNGKKVDTNKKPDYLGKTKRGVKKTGEKVADATGALTGGFGTSSFKKESITFKDFLNKL